MLLKTLSEKKGNDVLVIAALGDSLTYGWMVSKGYLDFLNEMIKSKYPDIKFKIFNMGVPGDTAEDGLRRIDDVISKKPGLVFIQFALNDAFIGHTPDRFKKNIEAVIKKIRKDTTAEILLITSVPVMQSPEDKIAGKFYDKIEECSDEYNIPVARVHDYWKTKIEAGTKFLTLVQSDGIHPVENGYRLMAEAIMEIL